VALSKIRDEHPVGASIAMVGHGGINPLLVMQQLGVPTQEGTSAINHGNDEIYHIDIFKARIPPFGSWGRLASWASCDAPTKSVLPRLFNQDCSDESNPFGLSLSKSSRTLRQAQGDRT
jgi:broad specificity phosphatase PhoE